MAEQQFKRRLEQQFHHNHPPGRGLFKELKPAAEKVTTWWQQAYNLPVALSDFRFSDPPEKFGATMIITFRDKLKALKAEQATQKLPL